MKGKHYRPRRKIAGIYLVDVILALIIFAIGLAMGYLMGTSQRETANEATETKAVEAVETRMAVAEEMPEPAEDEPLPEVVTLEDVIVTHYCACEKCCGKWADGITATGTTATEGRTIAVDPDVIPLGTEVRLLFEDGTEAVYIAEDVGGAIKGNRVDVYMDSHEAALVAGVQTATVVFERK